MSLIDTTYFTNELKLPNGQNDNLASDIERFQTEYLQAVLGFDFGTFMSGYDRLAYPIELRYLAEGNDFLMDGKSVSWGGFINEFNMSPIAYYVYYKVLESKHIRIMSTGLIQSKNENSMMATPHFKMVRAWNKMQALTCGEVVGGRVNLQTFLKEFADDYDPYGYDESHMFPFQRMNSFGI